MTPNVPSPDEITPDLFGTLTAYERKLTRARYRHFEANPYSYTWMTKVEHPTALQYTQVVYTTAWWDAGRRVLLLLLMPGTALATFAVDIPALWLLIPAVPLLLAALTLIALLLGRAKRTNAYFRDRFALLESPPQADHTAPGAS